MALDQIEVSTVELKTQERPRLYFHATGMPPHHFMTESGLLADGNTLTPSLEVAQDHMGDFLTFWYPKKGEIDTSNPSVTRPTIPLTEDEKLDLIKRLESKGLDSFHRQPIMRAIAAAKTLLPASRLGAVAHMNSYDVGYISSLLPHHENRFLTKYAHQKEALVQRVKDTLEDTKIDFIDPTLNREQLAADMVKTTIEHSLLTIGDMVKSATPGIHNGRLVSALEDLRQITFLDEPKYERYRQGLIKAIEALQSPTTSPTSTSSST